MSVFAERAEFGPEIKTLGQAMREFAKRHSPWMIGGAIALLVVIRILTGEPLTWRDAVAVAAMLVIYPFGEWAIHVHLLHLKPFRWRGRSSSGSGSGGGRTIGPMTSPAASNSVWRWPAHSSRARGRCCWTR